MLSCRKNGSGIPLTHVQLNAVIERVVARLRRDNRITPVDSFSGLPEEVQQEARRQSANPNEVRAAFHEDVLYLVRNNLHSEARAEDAIFHESFHRALANKYKGDGEKIRQAMN